MAREHVELYDFSDRPLEVRWNGMLLPYPVFRKDQRAQATSHRGEQAAQPALTLVKTQQDLKRATRVMTNGEKTVYKKNPRAIYGPEFVEQLRSRVAVEMTV